MLDDLIDRAWSCFNKMDKKPPDRSTNSSMIVAETLRRRSSIGGPMILDPSFLPDKQKLDSEFKQLLVVVDVMLETIVFQFQQELDLNPVKEQELRDQSAEKKWVMIMEHQSRQVSCYVHFWRKPATIICLIMVLQSICWNQSLESCRTSHVWQLQLRRQRSSAYKSGLVSFPTNMLGRWQSNNLRH